MAAAYSVFANGGFKITPFIINSIRNTQDKVIYQAKAVTACATCPADPPGNQNKKGDNTQAPRVISPQNAFLITSALHDVIQRGTATEAVKLTTSELAGKTGNYNNQ